MKSVMSSGLHSACHTTAADSAVAAAAAADIFFSTKIPCNMILAKLLNKQNVINKFWVLQ